jgi:hypothetical protein
MRTAAPSAAVFVCETLRHPRGRKNAGREYWQTKRQLEHACIGVFCATSSVSLNKQANLAFAGLRNVQYTELKLV